MEKCNCSSFAIASKADARANFLREAGWGSGGLVAVADKDRIVRIVIIISLSYDYWHMLLVDLYLYLVINFFGHEASYTLHLLVCSKL